MHDTAVGTHTVLFYEGERFLHRAIGGFFAEAMRTGQAAAMVARRRTFDAVSEYLATGPNAAPVPAADRILFVDADTALGTFMDGETPDPVRFEQSFESIIAALEQRGSGGTIWIYGEMVDVLCKAGNHAAALRLEELWNVLSAGRPVSVMCGYAIEDFDEDLHARTFRPICRQHTHVIPTEVFTEAPDDRTRLEQIAFLEQRARALGHQPPVAVADAAIAASTVYVIDDDESMRRSLARLLSSANLRVQTFESAETFLAEVDPASGGCLLVDAQLVGMSGSHLQLRMASAKWLMPVITMSGSHDAQIEAEALRLGARAFLSKPFDAQALLDAIARALSRE